MSTSATVMPAIRSVLTVPPRNGHQERKGRKRAMWLFMIFRVMFRVMFGACRQAAQVGWARLLCPRGHLSIALFQSYIACTGTISHATASYRCRKIVPSSSIAMAVSMTGRGNRNHSLGRNGLIIIHHGCLVSSLPCLVEIVNCSPSSAR